MYNMSYTSLPVKYDLYLRGNLGQAPKLHNVLSYILFKTTQDFSFQILMDDFKSYVVADINALNTAYSPPTVQRAYEGWEATPSTNRIRSRQEWQLNATNPQQQFTSLQWDRIFKRIPIWKNILSELKKYVTSFQFEEPNIDDLNNIINGYMHLRPGSDIYNDMMATLLGLYDSLGTLGPGAQPWSGERKTADNTDNVLQNERNGYLYQWYAWAAQFWLPKQHQSWFQEIYKISHSDEVNSIHRLATVVIVDDASDGLKQFVEITMQPLNMPTLKYVNICVNKDPWWFSPQQDVKKINVRCKVSFDSIDTQKNRITHLHAKIYKLKDKGGVVILYTSSCDLLGYCLYNQVNVYVETPWCGPVSIESLEQQVIAQTNLLGPATRYVNIETKRLTFICLMMLSISHGIPMYVSVGWNRTLTEWYKIVKEYQKPVKQQTADEDCIWLAKKYDDGIVLNQPIFMTLIVRLLNTAFTPDKKVVTGDGGTGYLHYLKRHYTEMKDENRLGSGKVKPVLVAKQNQQMLGVKEQLDKVAEGEKASQKYMEKALKIRTDIKSIKKKIDEEPTEQGKRDLFENMKDLEQELNKVMEEISKQGQPVPEEPSGPPKEWMYGQRLIFINNYYCPRDLDELLRIFRIRLTDWTGVSKISINL